MSGSGLQKLCFLQLPRMSDKADFILLYMSKMGTTLAQSSWLPWATVIFPSWISLLLSTPWGECHPALWVCVHPASLSSPCSCHLPPAQAAGACTKLRWRERRVHWHFPYFLLLGCLPHSSMGPWCSLQAASSGNSICASPLRTFRSPELSAESFRAWGSQPSEKRQAARAALRVGCTSEIGKRQICKAPGSSETLMRESWDSFDCTTNRLRTKQTQTLFVTVSPWGELSAFWTPFCALMNITCKTR